MRNFIWALVVLALSCATKPTGPRRPYWGDTRADVLKLEQRRIGQKPQRTDKAWVQYTDRILRQQCKLRYYFHDPGELRATVYTCTHPNGDRMEIENRIYKAFAEGYGSPKYISFRQEEFIKWQAKDAQIYVRMRKLRNLIISDIFYLKEPLESFPPLAAAPALPSWD